MTLLNTSGLSEESVATSLKQARSEKELIKASHTIQWVRGREALIRLQSIFKQRLDQIKGKK